MLPLECWLKHRRLHEYRANLTMICPLDNHKECAGWQQWFHNAVLLVQVWYSETDLRFRFQYPEMAALISNRYRASFITLCLGYQPDLSCTINICLLMLSNLHGAVDRAACWKRGSGDARGLQVRF